MLNDHAQRITNKDQARIDEMDRASEPLFLTVTILAVLIACAGIQEYHNTKKSAQQMSAMLADCANGKSIYFDGGLIQCPGVTRLVSMNEPRREP